MSRYVDDLEHLKGVQEQQDERIQRLVQELSSAKATISSSVLKIEHLEEKIMQLENDKKELEYSRRKDILEVNKNIRQKIPTKFLAYNFNTYTYI
jgi:chromosome segregation ATPase